MTYIRYKLVLLHPYGGQNLNLEIEGKVSLLVTFIQRFVTQSKLSIIFIETLLSPHKTAYFRITHITHTRTPMTTQILIQLT